MASGADHGPSATDSRGRRGCHLGPPGQEQHRRRGRDAVRRPGNERKRRAEQQEPGRGPGLGGSQLGPVLSGPLGELGFGPRGFGHAERGADARQVGHVTVTSGLVERTGSEPGVGAEEAVGLGDVHPGQQPRVRGRVRARSR